MLGGRFGSPRSVAPVPAVAAPPREVGSVVNAREVVLSDPAGNERVRLSAMSDGTPLLWMTDGTAEGTVQAPESAQRSLAQMVTKKISESVREISTKVLWEELGEEQSLMLTTHVSRVP